MRFVLFAPLALVALAGCVNVASQPEPTKTTTVVTPAPVVTQAPPGTVIVTRP